MEKVTIDRIYESVRKINHVYEIWASAHGLTLYELQIYYELVKNGDEAITQKDLCMKLDAPKTSINSIIKKQMQTGFIEMNINPQNKREKVISLTESGRKFAKELAEPLFRYEKEAADMIDDKEMEAAVEVHERFANFLLEKIESKPDK